MVARWQLLAAGLSARQIQSRVRRGLLHPVHRGVYAVGHPPLTRRAWWMAAVLAAEPGAALSHRTAAALHEIRPTERGVIELTARRRCVRPGLEVRVAILPADEQTVVAGIPVTTASRTLLDLAAVLAVRQLERALAEAERRRLGDPVGVVALLDRHPRAKGSGALRVLLARATHLSSWTRSELEEAFLAYVDAHDLPRPDLNGDVDTGGRPEEVDAVYRAARIAVELDSREWHDNRVAFAEDRAKSRRLTVAGWHPIRVAPEHLRTADLARDLSSMLARVP